MYFIHFIYTVCTVYIFLKAGFRCHSDAGVVIQTPFNRIWSNLIFWKKSGLKRFLVFLHFNSFPAPELPILERRNWLIHQHYLRKDYDTCKVRLPLPQTPHYSQVQSIRLRRSSPSLYLTRFWPARFQHAASENFTSSLNRFRTYWMFRWNIHVSFLFEDFWAEWTGMQINGLINSDVVTCLVALQQAVS